MKAVDYLNTMISFNLPEKQKEYYKYLLENGRIFTERENDKIVEKYNNNAQVKQCYKNSLLLALSTDLDYVEGYYIFKGLDFPIEHAWNFKNSVIDVTAYLLKEKPIEYFGITVPKDILADYILTDQRFTALQYYHHKIIKK